MILLWIKKLFIPLYRLIFLPKIDRVSDTIKINRDKYQGERCFIIGSGPSINNMDLSLLDSEVTFVVNRGFLLKENGLTSPTFYGISDRYAYKNYGDQIYPESFEHCFVIGDVGWSLNKENCSFFDLYTRNTMFKKLRRGFFQFDVTKPLSNSSTVVLHMLQIAVWLGFKEIYFIGVDNNFSLPNMHFYKDTIGEKRNMKRFSDPCKSNNQSFRKTYKILSKRGINIYNAGVGGMLDSIPRVDFYSLFKHNNRN